MPPIRNINLSDGITVEFTGGYQFIESALNIQGRLAGVSGNLTKKESRFNEWLQVQEPYANTRLLADYPLDDIVHTEPGNLPVWQWIDGDNVIEVICWVAVHIFNDSPLSFTIKHQNRELGPITVEWW